MACYTPAAGGGVGCPVNGAAGREDLPPLQPAARPRHIAVLGANLAALELAYVAATRGHHVELSTERLPLGGLLGLRAGVPGNAEFGRAFLALTDRLLEVGGGIVEHVTDGAAVVVDCRPGPERRPAWAHGRGVLLAGEVLGRDLHQMYGIGRRVAVVGCGALAAEVALFLAGWGRRPTVIVPHSATNPFPDVHPMHAARLRDRLEGYKATLVTDTVAVAWRYDPDRRSELRVTRQGAEEVLGPFHSAVSAAGWPAVKGQRPRVKGHEGDERNQDREPAWPQAVFATTIRREMPDGATFTLGDTPYAEPLRDLVRYAHLLGRRL
jgi:hypothetical protein